MVGNKPPVTPSRGTSDPDVTHLKTDPSYHIPHTPMQTLYRVCRGGQTHSCGKNADSNNYRVNYSIPKHTFINKHEPNCCNFADKEYSCRAWVRVLCLYLHGVPKRMLLLTGLEYLTLDVFRGSLSPLNFSVGV